MTQQKVERERVRPALPQPVRHHTEWITLIGDNIVGSGRTAHDAREAALTARPNERSQLLFMPPAKVVNVTLPENYARVCAALPPAAREHTWLVGGAVRAALMRRPVEDLDFVVAGNALAVARVVADELSAKYFPLDAERGVGRVLADSENGMVIDFARMHPSGITADLLARDFTINAMALPAAGARNLLDPAGGREHLHAKTVCMLSETALAADPIRVLRAVRLAAELGFHIDRGTRDALRNNAAALQQVSAERVRDEFLRCLGGPNPTGALRVLARLRLMQHVLAEWNADDGARGLSVCAALQALLSVLRPRHDVDAASEFALGLVAARVGRFRSALGDHLSACVVAPRNRGQLLYLAALLRAICANTQVRQRARALRLSNSECDILAVLAKTADLPQAGPRRGWGSNGGRAPTPMELSVREVHHFFRVQGASGVEACLLSLAETLAEHGPALPQTEWAQKVECVVALLDGYFNRYTEVIEPPALIDGSELMAALGISAGERVGSLLSQIKVAQAAGEVISREQALQLARTLHAQRGER